LPESEDGSAQAGPGAAGVSSGRGTVPRRPIERGARKDQTMKSKEEPSLTSLQGDPSAPASRQNPACLRDETTGPPSRPGRTAAAASEQRALSLFPELRRAAVVGASSPETVVLTLL
jgi:hypothetical protein